MSGLEQTLVTLRESESANALREALEKSLSERGFVVFNYGAGRFLDSVSPIVERLWSNMDPAWIERYRSCNYARLDRLVAAGLLRIGPFTFAEVFCHPPLLPEQQEMERNFFYQHGVVVPMHSPNGRFAMLSTAHEEAGRFVREATALMAEVALIAATTHERAEALAVMDDSSRLRLTEREQVCLRWSAYGRTSNEIAEILSISERTVRKHIGTAMAKLGVSSRTQAVARAIALGEVRI